MDDIEQQLEVTAEEDLDVEDKVVAQEQVVELSTAVVEDADLFEVESPKFMQGMVDFRENVFDFVRSNCSEWSLLKCIIYAHIFVFSIGAVVAAIFLPSSKHQAK